MVTVPQSSRCVLSRKNGPPSHPKTGAYAVDVESFESLALPSLPLPIGGFVPRPDGKSVPVENVIYVLDEIGRMELHSSAFRKRVNDLREAGVKLVGAITSPIYGHRVPFCDELIERGGKDIQVTRIKKSNRDGATGDVIKIIERRWGLKSTNKDDDEKTAKKRKR